MAGIDDFDLDASMERGWSEFAHRLADVVASMDDGGELTIGTVVTEQDARPPFIRFSCRKDGLLLAEASGNSEVDEARRLTAAQLAELSASGWQSPTENGDHPTPNLWREGTQHEVEPLVAAAVSVLRDHFGVPHPVFLAPDQLAEVLTPAPAVEGVGGVVMPDDATATMPRDADHLDSLVEGVLTDILGPVLIRDTDRDFAIRFGSAMVFVRVVEDAAEVLVYAVLVHEIEGRGRATEVVNDLNSDTRFVRFFLVRDRLFASISVPAQPFVAMHLRKALATMSLLADGIDDTLAEKLRGRTTFTDPPPESA
ncbi:MAG: hypothetical protein WAV45_01210 [Propionibacteriaceae bacterium]|nr:hypothetical protein [Micropruina sp.]HBX82943.1 hypothetical protein [Propionibacteriaceae bacterium]